MKKQLLVLTMLTTLFISSCNRSVTGDEQTVNPLLGDVSFTDQFGQLPTVETDDDLRIQTHLAYAENILWQKDVSALAPALQEKRKHLLRLLHAYWTAGIFPRNYDYANKRVPCFIDKNGKICAVGYLVEHTAGRQAAEHININHKYDEVLAMNDPLVDNWINSSGLTKEECAMIQPTYGYIPSPTPVYNYNHVSSGYGITSAILGGVNLSFGTINIMQRSKGKDSKAAPIIGLLTGAGSTIYGALQFPKDDGTSFYTYTNESKKTVSMLNIGLGTTTMILSAWNLFTNKPKSKNKTSAWNIYSFPTADSKMGLGFCFTKKL